MDDCSAQPLLWQQGVSWTPTRSRSRSLRDFQQVASKYTGRAAVARSKAAPLLFEEVVNLSRAGKEHAKHWQCSEEAIHTHCLPAGNFSGLLQLFHDHPSLNQKQVFKTALDNLPGSQLELLPSFYEEMVSKVGIQPNAASVAKVIQALGKLQREPDAIALWHDWLVLPFSAP